MGRIYQVDYDQALALCAEMERVINEMEGHAVALRGIVEPLDATWIPHGAIGKGYGETLSQRARAAMGEERASVGALRQSLLSLRALEEEQARRMRSARAF